MELYLLLNKHLFAYCNASNTKACLLFCIVASFQRLGATNYEFDGSLFGCGCLVGWFLFGGLGLFLLVLLDINPGLNPMIKTRVSPRYGNCTAFGYTTCPLMSPRIKVPHLTTVAGLLPQSLSNEPSRT